MPRAMASLLPTTGTNRLLAALSPRERASLVRDAKPVTLELGAVLAEPDTATRYVYFPLSGFISVMVPAGPDATLEVGLIGDEGLLGSTLLCGVDAAPFHALVQGPGIALRMTAARFRRELEARSTFAGIVSRYAYVQLRQVSQLAVCTRFHTIPERLARWLLMTQDRAGGAEFHLTQAFLARMLGVRRVSVTKAAGELQADRMIDYRRGEIVITDRRKLEAVSCVCYESDKRLYGRIMKLRR